MKFDADTTTKPTLRRIGLFLALATSALALAHLLDLPVYQYFHSSDAANRGLPKMFRGGGYIPLWVFVGLALVFLDTVKMRTLGLAGVLQRGVLIILCVALAGMLTEGTKTLIHRARPPETGWDGHYHYRWSTDQLLSTDSVGMPSSHAGVAFGAAWMLIRMYSRAAPLWILIGVGCAWQRLLDHAHFFSDVFASLLAGYMAAWAVWHGWRAWVGFPEVQAEARGLFESKTPLHANQIIVR
jgi:membrane-associated phospholipid phosphatase